MDKLYGKANKGKWHNISIVYEEDEEDDDDEDDEDYSDARD